MKKTIFRTIVTVAAGIVIMSISNIAAAYPSRGGSCTGCHGTNSDNLKSLTISPLVGNLIDIQKGSHAVLTFQVSSLGSSSGAAIAICCNNSPNLQDPSLNASIAAGGANSTWTLTTGTGGTSYISDEFFGPLAYTMDLAIGAAGTTGTYPLNVTLAGDGPTSRTFSFSLKISPAGVPGDYNNNGVVDAADYVLWRKGVQPLQNEVAVPIGTTDGADFTAWRARFGNTSGSGAMFEITAVPEATSLVLAVLGLLAIPIFPRSRWRR
jgi:hypothetical protein